MNKIISVLLIIFLIGCSEKKPQKENNDASSEKELNEFFADFSIMQDDEKISLIAIIKNVPKDSVSIIVKDYLQQTNTSLDSTDRKVDYEKVVKDLSRKYDLPQRKIANIIYTYKFETLTREDFENESENEREYAEDYESENR